MLIPVEIQTITKEGFDLQKMGHDVEDFRYTFQSGFLNSLYVCYINDSPLYPNRVEVGLTSGGDLVLKGTADELFAKIQKAQSDHNYQFLIGKCQ